MLATFSNNNSVFCNVTLLYCNHISDCQSDDFHIRWNRSNIKIFRWKEVASTAYNLLWFVQYDEFQAWEIPWYQRNYVASMQNSQPSNWYWWDKDSFPQQRVTVRRMENWAVKNGVGKFTDRKHTSDITHNYPIPTTQGLNFPFVATCPNHPTLTDTQCNNLG